MTQDPESVSIYDWAVTANLQPELISVEVWRNLPEDFCRQVELVNGQPRTPAAHPESEIA